MYSHVQLSINCSGIDASIAVRKGCRPASALNGRATELHSFVYHATRPACRRSSRGGVLRGVPSNPVSDPDMEVELIPIKELTKRPAAIRLSEESDSDFDPGKLSQPYVASQEAVVEKSNKAAAPTTAKNTNENNSDKAVVTAFPTPAPSGPKPPPVFV
ncbi:hypothetical protein EVAR_95608_1 [Eumeta japonica]|uniref:Uncharacterized protein n=1 Tax=Eumeta variegata TaxID=151549 RepID=A0A4C1VIR2_EUMVA|nr:hypothetical protein EVAR_95608_1 [Eumeta japonica]